MHVFTAIPNTTSPIRDKPISLSEPISPIVRSSFSSSDFISVRCVILRAFSCDLLGVIVRVPSQFPGLHSLELYRHKSFEISSKISSLCFQTSSMGEEVGPKNRRSILCQYIKSKAKLFLAAYAIQKSPLSQLFCIGPESRCVLFSQPCSIALSS